MIYLDNAATSFPKPKQVYKAFNRCIREYCGNPGRSSHILSVKAADEIYSAREKLSGLLGVNDPENIVFTLNATYALNIAIKSFVSKDCHVLTSDFEHNSVIRPLEKLKKELNLSYSCFDSGDNLLSSIEDNRQANTIGIITSIASNVTGDNVDLKIISDYATSKGLFLIIDASQTVGHHRIELSNTPCDALCGPGHKALFGIQGCGFVYFKNNRQRKTLIEGGSGTDSASLTMPEFLPEAYEAGTPPTPAIVSLGAGIDFINQIDIQNIESKLINLTSATKERLNSLSRIRSYREGVGHISFNVDNIPSTSIAAMLDSKGICVRGGLHCAPSVHKKIGTFEQGAVRISFSYFNSSDDVDRLYKEIRFILKTI